MDFRLTTFNLLAPCYKRMHSEAVPVAAIGEAGTGTGLLANRARTQRTARESEFNDVWRERALETVSRGPTRTRFAFSFGCSTGIRPGSAVCLVCSFLCWCCDHSPTTAMQVCVPLTAEFAELTSFGVCLTRRPRTLGVNKAVGAAGWYLCVRYVEVHQAWAVHRQRLLASCASVHPLASRFVRPSEVPRTRVAAKYFPLY